MMDVMVGVFAAIFILTTVWAEATVVRFAFSKDDPDFDRIIRAGKLLIASSMVFNVIVAIWFVSRLWK